MAVRNCRICKINYLSAPSYHNWQFEHTKMLKSRKMIELIIAFCCQYMLNVPYRIYMLRTHRHIQISIGATEEKDVPLVVNYFTTNYSQVWIKSLFKLNTNILWAISLNLVCKFSFLSLIVLKNPTAIIHNNNNLNT